MLENTPILLIVNDLHIFGVVDASLELPKYEIKGDADKHKIELVSTPRR